MGIKMIINLGDNCYCYSKKCRGDLCEIIAIYSRVVVLRNKRTSLVFHENLADIITQETRLEKLV